MLSPRGSHAVQPPGTEKKSRTAWRAERPQGQDGVSNEAVSVSRPHDVDGHIRRCIHSDGDYNLIRLGHDHRRHL